MAEFNEIGDRVWSARYDWYDVNVTAIETATGLVVVDTGTSSGAAREVLADLRRRSSLPVVAVVNTHHHFDHVLGNHAFASEYAGDGAALPIHAHEAAVEATVRQGEEVQAGAVAAGLPRAEEIAATPLLPANRPFSSAAVIATEDRSVELVHPGRGHTAGDLVVVVPDADVVLVGDLVEESAPPSYGDDCFPLDWPASLDLVLQLIGPDTAVVPGHGAVVDRSFVLEQRAEVGVVAETIRHLAGSGVPVDRALAEGEWPFPEDRLRHAVQRGYDQLPRSARRLPLL